MKAKFAALLACVMYAGCGGGGTEEPVPQHQELDAYTASLIIFHKELGEYVATRNRLMTETASIATATATTSSEDVQGKLCPLDYKGLRGVVLTSTAAPLDKLAIKSMYDKYSGCVPGGSSFLEALARATSNEDPNFRWYSADRLGRFHRLEQNGLFGMMDSVCEQALADGTTCEPFEKDGMTTEDVDVQAAGAAAFTRDLWATITVASKYKDRSISEGDTGMALFALGHKMGIDTLQAALAQATKRGSSDDPCEWIVTAMWRHRSGSVLEDNERTEALTTCREYTDSVMKKRAAQIKRMDELMYDFSGVSARLIKLVDEAKNSGYELNMGGNNSHSLDCPLMNDKLRGEMPLSTMSASDLEKLYEKYGECLSGLGATMLRIFAKIEPSGGNPKAQAPTNTHLRPDRMRFGLFQMNQRLCMAALQKYSMENICPKISTDAEVQMAAGAARLRGLAGQIESYDEKAAGIKYSDDTQTYLTALMAGYFFGEGALNKTLRTPLDKNGPTQICETLVDFWSSSSRYKVPSYPLTPSEKEALVGRCLGQERE